MANFFTNIYYKIFGHPKKYEKIIPVKLRLVAFPDLFSLIFKLTDSEGYGVVSSENVIEKFLTKSEQHNVLNFEELKDPEVEPINQFFEIVRSKHNNGVTLKNKGKCVEYDRVSKDLMLEECKSNKPMQKFFDASDYVPKVKRAIEMLNNKDKDNKSDNKEQGIEKGLFGSPLDDQKNNSLSDPELGNKSNVSLLDADSKEEESSSESDDSEKDSSLKPESEDEKKGQRSLNEFFHQKPVEQTAPKQSLNLRLLGNQIKSLNTVNQQQNSSTNKLYSLKYLRAQTNYKKNASSFKKRSYRSSFKSYRKYKNTKFGNYY